MAYYKCNICHRWYDTEEFEDVIDFCRCPQCSEQSEPITVEAPIEINATLDETDESCLRDLNDLDSTHVDFDEGIDNDYIDGELSLNDGLGGYSDED